MARHSVVEAKNQLSSLIDRALAGEEVVITRHGAPVVELRAVSSAGLSKGPMTEEDFAWLDSRRVKPRSGPINAGDLISQMRDEDDERLLRR